MSSKGRDPGNPLGKAALQAQCDEWNKAYPVGTEVIRTDGGSEYLTNTRGQAMVASGQAVIWADGMFGSAMCWLLDHIKPRKCRVCGCHTTRGCIVEGPPGGDIITGCHWVEKDLCSACVGRVA